MKTFVSLLIVETILGIGVANICKSCNWEADLHCGTEAGGGCMVTAINKCTVELISCQREKRGAKPLVDIVPGKCPASKPKCR